MADGSQERLPDANRYAFKSGLAHFSDVLALAWVTLVFMALAVPPLLVETVVLGDGWPAFPEALEAALRWQFGHVPHVDYHTPIGPAYWLGQGVAVAAIGFEAKSSLVANFISGAALVLPGLFLVRPRLTGLMTAVLMTGVISLVLSLRPLDQAGGTIGEIAAPARASLAIAAILLVAFFLEPRSERKSTGAALESLLVAALLVWLVFLDPYIAVLVLLSGGAALAFPTASRGLVIEATTFAALACVGIGFLTGVGLPYVIDIEAAVAAAPVFRLDKLVGDIEANLLPLATAIAALGLAALLSRVERRLSPDTVAVTAVLIVFSVLAMNRSDILALPLLFVSVIVLAARAAKASGAAQQGQKIFLSKLRKILPAHAPALATAITLVGLASAADLISLKTYLGAGRDEAATKLCGDPQKPACAIWLLGVADAGATVLPDPLIESSENTDLDSHNAKSGDEISALCGDDTSCLRREVYTELVGLLNQIMKEGDKPLMLGAANPLPYYYNLEPPRNVTTTLVPGRSLSLKHHPNAQKLFSDASVLAVPKSDWNPEFRRALVRLYEGDIARMYDLVVETDVWSIYRKSIVRPG